MKHAIPWVLLGPVVRSAGFNAQWGEMTFAHDFEHHMYSGIDGAYLGVEPPRNFPTPFPAIDLFPRWGRLSAWFAHVRRLRLRLVDPKGWE